MTFLLCLNRMRTGMLSRIRQLMIPGYRRRQSRNFLTTYSVLQLFPIMLTLIQLRIWQTISWYLTIRMPLKPHPHMMGDELNTHDGLLKNYKSFHVLSGDQDRKARTSAYHELINLMLSQMLEDKHLINVTAARTKTSTVIWKRNQSSRRSRKICISSGPT